MGEENEGRGYALKLDRTEEVAVWLSLRISCLIWDVVDCSGRVLSNDYVWLIKVIENNYNFLSLASLRNFAICPRFSCLFLPSPFHASCITTACSFVLYFSCIFRALPATSLSLACLSFRFVSPLQIDTVWGWASAPLRLAANRMGDVIISDRPPSPARYVPNVICKHIRSQLRHPFQIIAHIGETPASHTD